LLWKTENKNKKNSLRTEIYWQIKLKKKIKLEKIKRKKLKKNNKKKRKKERKKG
jgi:hypothetical protein